MLAAILNWLSHIGDAIVLYILATDKEAYKQKLKDAEATIENYRKARTADTVSNNPRVAERVRKYFQRDKE